MNNFSLSLFNYGLDLIVILGDLGCDKSCVFYAHLVKSHDYEVFFIFISL
jgi:hypothetical protein